MLTITGPKCNNCLINYTKNKFTKSQLKLKNKRKCKQCVYKNNIGKENLFNIFKFWLIENNVKFDKLKIININSNQRSVITSQRAKPNTTLAKIPNKCIIALDNIQKSDIGQTLSKDSGISKHTIIALGLLHEKYKPDSYWKPYIDILPIKFSNIPLFYNQQDLDLLKGSLVDNMTKARHIQLKLQYEKIIKLGFKYTYTEFVWARTIVITRIFKFNRSPSISTTGLVPFADMLNHSNNPNTKWEFDYDINCFTIKNYKWSLKGREIFDTYGHKCNSRYLVNYGFTLQDNIEHNEASIFLPYSQLAGSLCKPSSFDCGFTNYNLLITHNKETKITKQKMYRFQVKIIPFDIPDYNKPIKCINKLFFIARLYCHEFGKLPEINIMETPISEGNEINAINLISKYAKIRLEEFGDIDEEKLIFENKQYTNIHNIAMIRIGEKTILNWYIGLSNFVNNYSIQKTKNNKIFKSYYNLYWKNKS